MVSRGHHSHIVALDTIHAFGRPLQPTEDVPTPDDYPDLATPPGHPRYLRGVFAQPLRVYPIRLPAHQRLAAQFEQNP